MLVLRELKVLKALVIVILVVAVFGSGAYWTYELFLRPGKELKEEKGLPPPPPPPDPSLPEFARCVGLENEMKVLEARGAYEQFLVENPQSTRIDEARERLGRINASLFLSPIVTPEKELYIVKSGDVLNKVAARMKTTPELIMHSNNLNTTMLRIGQRLLVASGSFSVVINKRLGRVTVLKDGRFFKQYPIRASAGQSVAARKATALIPAKTAGKVTEKIAWSDSGERVSIADKEYWEAAHWIVLNPSGDTLYSDPEPKEGRTVNKPPQGLGMAPEHMEELAALLRRGDPVSIEP